MGPFYVLVDTLRVQLGKKCKELARALLEYMVQRLKVETDEICSEFNKISRKLFDRPNAIEVCTYILYIHKQYPVYPVVVVVVVVVECWFVSSILCMCTSGLPNGIDILPMYTHTHAHSVTW